MTIDPELPLHFVVIGILITAFCAVKYGEGKTARRKRRQERMLRKQWEDIQPKAVKR